MGRRGAYYHFYDYLDDLTRVLGSLPDRIGLVGHSMGGTLATMIAALHPDRFSWAVLLEGHGSPCARPRGHCRSARAMARGGRARSPR
ncbi:MAG: alpha/beta hydrolase [Myxococcales bacterium]|nr:alpha/beta hydrolase [Myxococcales bacterium]